MAPKNTEEEVLLWSFQLMRDITVTILTLLSQCLIILSVTQHEIVFIAKVAILFSSVVAGGVEGGALQIIMTGVCLHDSTNVPKKIPKI